MSLNANAQNATYPHPNDSVCLVFKEIHSQDQVDQAAIPPSGFMNFREEVNKKIKMPLSAIENGIAGRVTLEFVICDEGFTHNILVLKSKSEDCDQEAVRVLSSMGSWMPAQIDNKDVSSKVRYSFNFRKKH